MPILVLLRHGQSLWNKEGRFTGWTDIDLSDKGVGEARDAGRLLKSCGMLFDVAYTSVLKRAIRTLWIVLDEMDLMWIPIITCWRLNERNYGALQGVSKKEVEERYGPEQIHKWRRGFTDQPPAMDLSNGRYSSVLCDPRYRDLEEDQIPKGESLKDTLVRLLPCWENKIAPDLKEGKKVFVSSHGNTLRALAKHIEGISDEDIERFEIPTGIPLAYRLDEDLRPVDRFYLKSREDCKKLRLDESAGKEEQGTRGKM
ncbi:MAG: 2,3-diphosphoglycerate-dependent phosphoglycerate mutase [Methanotrichaceae archaeon]